MTSVNGSVLSRRFVVLPVLAALVLLAYAPALRQPLLEDDYPNIAQARLYGPVSGWGAMVHDPVFRWRTTSWLLLNGVNRIFGMQAWAYYAVTILLQVVNTWLVYALGAWRPLGYEMSALAAGFFAVYEGHQEAIMWVSAVSEPLMLCFGLLALLAWIRFLDSRKPLFYVASLAAFCLALISKESAVIFAALLILPIVFRSVNIGRNAAWLAPFAALACTVVFLIVHARTSSFRFQDGSFSLQAPFWTIWPYNIARVLWFWGWLALLAIVALKPRGYGRMLGIAGAWIAIGLIPYSFLTYSTRIPSRQLYLASVGLCLIVAFALLDIRRRYSSQRAGVVLALCAVAIGINVVYLWTKKRSQYLERAAPTEQLVAVARNAAGPIYIQCFPQPPIVAEAAIQLMNGRPASDLIWNSAEAASRHASTTFCYKGR